MRIVLSGVCLILLAVIMPIQAQSSSVFVNATSASGLAVPPAAGPLQGFYAGSAWRDFDGDGDMDLFSVTHGLGDITLWVNDGTGVFSPSIVLAGSGTPRADHGVAAADFDNDGDQDVIVTQGEGAPNLLFVNQGNGVFTEEAATRGLTDLANTQTASWGDFDRDGWLDLYLGNMYTPTSGAAPRILYRSNGDGTFTDVTSAAGVANPGLALAELFFDLDQDGWPDIVYGNDRGETVMPPAGVLHNNADGTFTEIGPAIGANALVDCMGITIGDIENDGDWDVYITNSNAGDVLLRWDEPSQSFDFQGTWPAVANSMGLSPYANGWDGWNAKFFDYDNDGWIDLLVQSSTTSNRLFRGQGALPFVETTWTDGAALALPAVFAGAVVDYDDDGRQDVWLANWYTNGQLIRNQGATGNWLVLDLEGTVSNRDAMGAQVRFVSASGVRLRQVTSGEGFLCESDPRVHVGLGGDTIVSQIEIRWPSGTVQYLHNVAVNQFLSVVEPRFDAVGPLSPGTLTSFNLDLAPDAGLFFATWLGLTTEPPIVLPDGRRIRISPGDPLAVFATTPGNPLWIGFAGMLDSTGAGTTILGLPNLPYLTGASFHAHAVTLDATFSGGVRTIVGPQGFAIQ